MTAPTKGDMMKFETFRKRWQELHPNSLCELAGDFKGSRVQVGINVTYTNGGKVYCYSGTIKSIAESLKLIPVINVRAEAKRIASALRNGEQPVGYWACEGDVNDILSARGLWSRTDGKVEDEFGRPMRRYSLVSAESLAAWR